MLIYKCIIMLLPQLTLSHIQIFTLVCTYVCMVKCLIEVDNELQGLLCVRLLSEWLMNRHMEF